MYKLTQMSKSKIKKLNVEINENNDEDDGGKKSVQNYPKKWALKEIDAIEIKMCP